MATQLKIIEIYAYQLGVNDRLNVLRLARLPTFTSGYTIRLPRNRYMLLLLPLIWTHETMYPI